MTLSQFITYFINIFYLIKKKILNDSNKWLEPNLFIDKQADLDSIKDILKIIHSINLFLLSIMAIQMNTVYKNIYLQKIYQFISNQLPKKQKLLLS